MSLCRLLRKTPTEFFEYAARDQRDLLLDEEERERERDFNAYAAIESAVNQARKRDDKTNTEVISAEIVTAELIAALVYRTGD